MFHLLPSGGEYECCGWKDKTWDIKTRHIDSKRARILKITANNKRHSYFSIHCSLANFLYKLFGKCINSRDQIFKFKMSNAQYFHLNGLLINAWHSIEFPMLPTYQIVHHSLQHWLSKANQFRWKFVVCVHNSKTLIICLSQYSNIQIFTILANNDDNPSLYFVALANLLKKSFKKRKHYEINEILIK